MNKIKTHYICCVCKVRINSNAKNYQKKSIHATSFSPKFLKYIGSLPNRVEYDNESVVCSKDYNKIKNQWALPNNSQEHPETGIEFGEVDMDIEAPEFNLNPEDDNTPHSINYTTDDGLEAMNSDTSNVDFNNDNESLDAAKADAYLREIATNQEMASKIIEMIAVDSDLAVEVLGILAKHPHIFNRTLAYYSELISQNEDNDIYLDSQISLGQSSTDKPSQDFPGLLDHDYSQPSLKSQVLESGQSQSSISQVQQLPESQRSDLSLPISSHTSQVSNSSASTFLVKGIRSAVVSENFCFICRKATRCRVPKNARRQVWLKRLILVPENNRCCTNHWTHGQYFSEDVLDRIEAKHQSTYISAQDLGEFLIELTEAKRDQLKIDFRDPNMCDTDYKLLTGFDKAVFQKLFRITEPKMRNSSNRDKINALGMFLMVMRLNLTQRVLAYLFGTTQAIVSNAVESVSDILLTDFVPLFLGRKCLSRENAIKNHSRKLAEKLYDAEGKLLEVWDGTYVYIETPGDNDLQREFYSCQKKCHLVKMMIACLSDGHIVEVSGPYSASSNDASIQILMLQNPETRQYYQKDDVILVDRGFRDSVAELEKLGLRVFIPSHSSSNRPFTTEQGNSTRRVTMLRWIIEAVNGRLKNLFRFFDGSSIEAGYMKQIDKFFRICCALMNAFCPPLLEDKVEHERIATKVLDIIDMSNLLYDRLETNGLLRKTKKYQTLSQESVPNFPQMTWPQLLGFTMGVYQLRRAQKYNKEHLQENSDYELQYYVEQEYPTLLRVKFQSRHMNATKYDVFVEADHEREGLSGILGYWCSCKSGARIVGCCSHVAAVVRFLSYDRHQPANPNARVRKPIEFINSNTELKARGICVGKRKNVAADDVENESNVLLNNQSSDEESLLDI